MWNNRPTVVNSKKKQKHLFFNLINFFYFRLETPINNDIDPLSTLLFVLTQTLIDVHQNRLTNLHHIQLSNDDIIHRKCYLNRIQQLPLCWLTILHQVLLKRQNINIILINFKQFLIKIHVENSSCALNLFDMTVWKMMDEIMKICYQYLIVKNQKQQKRIFLFFFEKKILF